ncbi:MAG: hypothetical protein K8S25_06920 [Alphaproteobacteria bacterium]|nr:hypothetical protein [Alphaproteobacteria bacterium]
MPNQALLTATIDVAASYRCSRETRELGEDYTELKKIDRAYRLLERRLTRAALRLQTRDAIRTVTEFNLLLADARHDASWPPTLALAKDAHTEARVIRMVRAFNTPPQQ